MSVNPFPRSTSTNSCNATNIPATPIPGGTTPIVKVPVVLQEVEVQIPMHARIDFPRTNGDNPVIEDVLEIKTIGKKTFLTQCKLINRPGARNGKLFISGFVRKNIQYASNPDVDPAGEILSTIKSLTVEVPFDCVAEIDSFLTPPVGPITDTRDEFGYLISKPLGEGFPEKDRLAGSDLSQFHQISSQNFNEMPYCELIRADIIEIDESLNRTPFPVPGQSNVIGEGTFFQLSEKMVLDLRLKLLQNQQVRLDSLGPVRQEEQG